MGKINVLSFEIANLIAAGEVVERPSSVLKELIENSIDAGSTEIIAEIKKGGVSLIRVTDNGHGIDKEDLPVAIKRHATSKISEREDLYSIMTLGFRGEALAAISSVSQVTIITKTKEADIGHMLTSEGGQIVDISEVGASDGTTVVVENLFYNVPARRKFLKKDATEAMNVSALVEKIALSRPDISIQLLIDGEERFKTSGDGNLKNTVRAVFGKEFSEKLIKVEGESDGIKVSGFVGRSDNVRKNRNLENVFINGRYVKSLTAQAAIEKAFVSYIAPECFPVCALFISMHPGVIDVNVHPSKLEVKFSDERRVFESVYYSVKNAIENEEYRPEISLAAKKPAYNPISAFVAVEDNPKTEQIKFGTHTAPASRDYAPKADMPTVQSSYSGYKPASSTTGFSAPARFDYTPTPHRTLDYDKPLKVASVGAAPAPKQSITSREMSAEESIGVLKKYEEAKATPAVEKENTVETPSFDYKFVGEAFDTYVIIEYDSELLIIDKHAAHERVIFEDLKKRRASDTRVGSQPLLLPISVILTADEISAVKEYADEFNSIGFEFNLLDKSCDITAIPDAISVYDAEGLFVKMAGEIVDGRGNPAVTEAVRREKALYQIACKAAIKGGRVYDKALIDWLINKVLSLPDITVCPHGRPIAYKLKKSELDRQFDRIK